MWPVWSSTVAWMFHTVSSHVSKCKLGNRGMLPDPGVYSTRLVHPENRETHAEMVNTCSSHLKMEKVGIYWEEWIKCLRWPRENRKHDPNGSEGWMLTMLLWASQHFKFDLFQVLWSACTVTPQIEKHPILSGEWLNWVFTIDFTNHSSLHCRKRTLKVTLPFWLSTSVVARFRCDVCRTCVLRQCASVRRGHEVTFVQRSFGCDALILPLFNCCF